MAVGELGAGRTESVWSLDALPLQKIRPRPCRNQSWLQFERHRIRRYAGWGLDGQRRAGGLCCFALRGGNGLLSIARTAVQSEAQCASTYVSKDRSATNP